MAMKKVSIIMPVYNCEHYLTESLDSVLKQTLQEWELLCIDDGSSDNSLKILKEYETNDSRIIVFSQTNKGAGQARNFGIQHACGEYIAFLDADDYFFADDVIEEFLYDMRFGMPGTNSIQHYLNILDEYGFVPTEAVLTQLLNRIMKMMNAVPIWPNNGWSPIELFHRNPEKDSDIQIDTTRIV